MESLVVLHWVLWVDYIGYIGLTPLMGRQCGTISIYSKNMSVLTIVTLLFIMF